MLDIFDCEIVTCWFFLVRECCRCVFVGMLLIGWGCFCYCAAVTDVNAQLIATSGSSWKPFVAMLVPTSTRTSISHLYLLVKCSVIIIIIIIRNLYSAIMPLGGYRGGVLVACGIGNCCFSDTKQCHSDEFFCRSFISVFPFDIWMSLKWPFVCRCAIK